MLKKFVKDYLSFTKKDRIGVIVLVTLIFIVVLLPYLWPVKKTASLPKEEIEKIKLLAAQLKKGDSTTSREEEPLATAYLPQKTTERATAETFYFDPNTLDIAGWKRLGLRDRTAATIRHFVEKGGKFRQPEDIGKIYGLSKTDYLRLLPFVKITAGSVNNTHEAPAEKQVQSYMPAAKTPYVNKQAANTIIDINIADTTALIALPGIGSKLASRIISFRTKLGGFYEVAQVAETYGLPDSTFQKIKPNLQCNHPVLQKININTADANTLKQHPYIRWNIGNAIVQYRNQHGNFKALADLQLISIVTPDIYSKISPYLVLE